MRRFNRYIPLIFFIPYLWFSNFNSKPATLNVLVLFAVIILIIGFFEILDRTRVTRSGKWNLTKSTKTKFALSYAFFIGLPISILLDFSIYGKAGLLTSFFFINLPVTFLFGWIGINEWNQLYKIYLDKKYFDKS